MVTSQKARTISVAAAAGQLGVSESHLRNQLRAGAIPLRVLKIGRRTVIPQAALDEYLDGAA